MIVYHKKPKMLLQKRRSIIVLGFALFAMFFGAGNLLLPTFLGFESGGQWPVTFAGFTSTGIIAPVLGIIAVMVSGNYFIDLGKRVNTKMAYILATVNILCIGPFIAIPRTGASVYEVAVRPLVPDAKPVWVCVLFFSVVMVLSFSKDSIVKILGKYLSPLLLLLLILFIVFGLISGGSITATTPIAEPFLLGFQEGYQTLDVLASVIFAVVLINGAKIRGFTQTEAKNEIVVKSTLLAVLCMLVIYGGLFYLGATSGLTDHTLTRSQLLIQISASVFGTNGVYFISALMILACLTTAIALTSAVADYFARITKSRLGYTEGVIMCTLISVILAINGVDEIIHYAGALLNFIYPITLVLILSVLFFGKFIMSKVPFLTAVIVTAVVSFIRVFSQWYPDDQNLKNMVNALPLASFQLEWVLPAIASFVIGILATSFIKK